MCTSCLAIFVATGKVDRVVPTQREPSPPTSVSQPDPTAGPSNTSANIQEVVNQAMEEAANLQHEEEDEDTTERERLPVIYGSENDEGAEPEYKNYDEEAAKEDVPRPFPYGTDELGDDNAHPIDSNYLVSLTSAS